MLVSEGAILTHLCGLSQDTSSIFQNFFPFLTVFGQPFFSCQINTKSIKICLPARKCAINFLAVEEFLIPS